jgi:hypothetical protein
MRDRELCRQRFQTQLAECSEQIAALKARAAAAGGDVRLEMDNYLRELERGMHDVGARLAELAAAGEERWDAAIRSVESSWGALETGVTAAAAQLDQR